jgi:hypothetical protein
MNMDPVTAALSQAWLQAMSRIQNQPVPQLTAPEPPRTMVDLFERVLRHADPQAADPQSAGKVVDRLV